MSEVVITYFNGDVIVKYETVNERKHGKYEKYYRDNVLMILCYYANGVRHGSYIKYYPTGVMKKNCNYKNGLLHSECLSFYPKLEY